MTRPAEGQHGVLVLSCQDAPGIVHAVSGLLVEQRCTILESHQFDSPSTGIFYMRVEFAHLDGTPLDFPALRQEFEETAQRFGMAWRLTDAAERQRVLIMVSQYVPLEQLCLSPQCGFSSTVEGNAVTYDQQVAKLELVVETAAEVWG